eukprot:g34236.t1
MKKSCSSRSLCAELAQGSPSCWGEQQAGSRLGQRRRQQWAAGGSEECSVISAVPRSQRCPRAVCVLDETAKPNSPEWGALQCLARACKSRDTELLNLPFGKLDFGETPVLDSFYNA